MIRLFFASILFISCSGRVQNVTNEELNSYVMDPGNGLVKRVTKDGTVLEIVYRPKDQVIAQTAGMNDALWLQEQRRLDSMDYFILRLSKHGKEIESSWAGDASAYNRAVAYLAGGISNDIRMKLGNEILMPEQTVYVPAFGSAGTTSIMLAFRSSLHARKGSFSIAIGDAALGTGRTEFIFTCSDISAIPRLKH